MDAYSKRTSILGYNKLTYTNAQSDSVAGGRFYRSMSAPPKGSLNFIAYFRGEFPFPASAGEKLTVSSGPRSEKERIHIRIFDLGQDQRFSFQIDMGLSKNSQLTIPCYIQGLRKFLASPLMGVLARPMGNRKLDYYYPIRIRKSTSTQKLWIALYSDLYLERINWKIELQPIEEKIDAQPIDNNPAGHWQSLTHTDNGTPLRNFANRPIFIDLGELSPGKYQFDAWGYSNDGTKVRVPSTHLLIDPILD